MPLINQTWTQKVVFLTYCHQKTTKFSTLDFRWHSLSLCSTHAVYVQSTEKCVCVWWGLQMATLFNYISEYSCVGERGSRWPLWSTNCAWCKQNACHAVNTFLSSVWGSLHGHFGQLTVHDLHKMLAMLSIHFWVHFGQLIVHAWCKQNACHAVNSYAVIVMSSQITIAWCVL